MLMEVTVLKPGERVQWRVVDAGAGGWVATEVDFMIFWDHGTAFLHFRLSKRHKDAKAFPHCSMGWTLRAGCVQPAEHYQVL